MTTNRPVIDLRLKRAESNQKRLGTIDLDTGEVMEGVNVFCPTSKKTGFQTLYGWRYCIMAQDAMTMIAADKDITGETFRVFFYMAGRLDFENYIRIQQTEIMEALNLDKSNVSKAVKILEKKNILLRGPKVGQSYSWRMNPNFGYKGDPRGKVYKVGNEVVFRVLEGGKADTGDRKKIGQPELSQAELEAAGQLRIPGADLPDHPA